MHLYWRLSRGLTLGVRAAVIDERNAVFLVRHSYVKGWHLPGGGVEPGETLLEALSRELQEEGNITLTQPPALHGVFFNGRAPSRDHVAVFVARHFVQSTPKARDAEIVETGFFPLDALPADTSQATRRRLKEIGEGAVISPLW
ncbi:NUDIX domain-containing protein [Chelatococcus sp. GCM10030263]|uniref:NUDIX domain-containing protein n=1 Tax=Chelatococcus sp. GCM10030263 TaxID=3273387 RepID=UPI00360A5FDD